MKLIKLFILSTLVMMTLLPSAMVTAESSTKNYAIQKFLVDEANRQNIDPALALAIAQVESDFNPRALSSAGAKGIMQIMPATAEGVFGVSSDQLFDTKINIELGIRFIKRLLARYNQRTDIALSHYNGGSAVQGKYGELTVIPATQKYVDKVLSARQNFKYKAYQLSDSPVKAAFKDNLISKVSIKGKKQQKVEFNSVSSIQNNTKNIAKQSALTPNKLFDKQRYEKVEQLRTLRLHNIMRNTKSHGLVGTTISNNKLAQTKIAARLRQDIPLSDKRKKVLSWEKMFN